MERERSDLVPGVHGMSMRRDDPGYMREYYRQNKHRWNKPRPPEKQAEYNAKRREQYATDPVLRERLKSVARGYRTKYPDRAFAQDLRHFGITVEQYAAMLARQGGGCAICGRADSPDNAKRTASGRRRLHIDHCHASGRVRGLLCSSCNLGLGKFHDNPERIDRAAVYLRQGGSETPHPDQ